jgi:hypothetical protein
MVKDKFKRMKADQGDKLVDQNCSTCEFNFGKYVLGTAQELITVKIHIVCK